MTDPQSTATMWTTLKELAAATIAISGVVTLIIQNHKAAKATKDAADKVAAVAHKAEEAALLVTGVKDDAAMATRNAEEAVRKTTEALAELNAEALRTAQHRTHEEGVLASIFRMLDGERSVDLALLAEALRRISNFTGIESDKEAATAAEERLALHKKTLALVSGTFGKPMSGSAQQHY
jgi:hypothetical protein